MAELFETTRLGSISLKNRFVRAATWLGLADEDGTCTDRLIDATVAVARGGSGLIMTGFASVSRAAQVVPRQLDASADRFLPGLTHLATAVHASDVPILLQLQHGGLFANPTLTGEKPAGPSAYNRGHMPAGRRLRINEIEALVQDFAAASRRAITAGFDGVEIDAAHGLLPGQFLSRYFNRRVDRYGGSLANRAQFLVDIVVAIREAIGDERLLVVKLSTSDYLMEGIRPDEFLDTAVALERAGINALEISGGTFYGFKVKNPEITFTPVFRDDVYYEHAARECRALLSIPIMLDGGIRSAETARRLVVEGVTDYVCLARPLICEPNLVAQWRSGRESDSQCQSDVRCLQPGLEGRGVYCVHSKGYRRLGGGLAFYSGSTSAVNTERAVEDCLGRAFGDENTNADFVLFHATAGHALCDVSAAIAGLCPDATIVGTTCLGTIGAEGPRSGPHSLAIMATRGRPNAVAVATVRSIPPAGGQIAGRQLARALGEAAQQRDAFDQVAGVVARLRGSRGFRGRRGAGGRLGLNGGLCVGAQLICTRLPLTAQIAPAWTVVLASDLTVTLGASSLSETPPLLVSDVPASLVMSVPDLAL